MLRAIGWLLKTGVFAVAVLVAGTQIGWSGRTLAEHVRHGVNELSRSGAVDSLKELAHKLTQEARGGFERQLKSGGRLPSPAHAAALVTHSRLTDTVELHASAARPEEQIPPSERQKLRALIRELNSARDQD